MHQAFHLNAQSSAHVMHLDCIVFITQLCKLSINHETDMKAKRDKHEIKIPKTSERHLKINGLLKEWAFHVYDINQVENEKNVNGK